MISLLSTADERRTSIFDAVAETDADADASSMRLQQQRERTTSLRKRKNTIDITVHNNCEQSIMAYNAEEEEEVIDEDEDVDNEEIYMIPISPPSLPTRTRTRTTSRQWNQQLQQQHPRRRRCYRQPSRTKSTKEEVNSHQPLVFLERRIARSVSLGCDNNNKERPCMKKTTARCTMVDCPILRPYRQLSSEYLQCLGELEEFTSTHTTTTTTNSDDYTEASDSNNSAIDSDCECDYDLDNPANEKMFPVIPVPVAFTTDTTRTVVPSENQFSKKKMDYEKRNSALLSYKSLDYHYYPSNEQQQQRPCMAESTTSISCNNSSRGGGSGLIPMSLILGLPIMPRRKLSINDILFNADDLKEEEGGDNE